MSEKTILELCDELEIATLEEDVTFHAGTHATGGSDPITPESIGAAEAGHTHTPESIGAAEAGHTHEDYMSKTTYGGSADGVVKSADKLQTARRIGSASFDGTRNLALYDIGAEPATIHYASMGGDKSITLGRGEFNVEYNFAGPLTSLSIDRHWSLTTYNLWLRFTAGDSITVTFREGTTFIGGAPTFEPGKTYEISIKDDCAVCAEVVSA